MNYKMILNILGWVLKIEAACMLLPLLCAVCYGETAEIYVFVLCALLCLLVGTGISLRRPKNKVMYAREGFVAVALSWVLLSIFGALPFVISKNIPNFIDAFFETVSGFTTTGASILTDVEALPKSLLMWRSFSHWLGGMGVLVFLMAILPLSGSGNVFLLKAESPGPAVSKLVPKVKSTAKLLYLIYIAFTVFQIVLMLLGGEDLFTSLTLTFGTAGTGGFGILNSGIAGYSRYTQYLITVFMIAFGVDFSLYYMLFFRNPKSFFKSDELKTYLLIIAAAIFLIFCNTRYLFDTTEETFRNVSFTVGSIITTTGYSTYDFNLWPQFSKTILVLLMFIGACAGSTGGGIKVSRIMILCKSIVKEIRLYAHPRTTLKLKMSGRTIEHETVRGVNVYMSAYVCFFVGALLIISFDNFDFTTNFTAIAATMNNIGPGLNMVGPMGNFSAFSPLSKMVMSICMLVGRLEIFPMLMLFSPYTWKK
ncbi:MAG: TrkH family potassium uptake protein [Ruminococcaceae bacterium]|nr:TrkH family potassium uptake protein [Oscillospiraceae bacterium]